MSYETEMISIMANVWEQTLSAGLWPIQSDEPDESNAEKMLAGCVQITGQWRGSVIVRCPDTVAQKAAEKMFSPMKPPFPDDLVADALAEITNQTGGGIKALLPQPSDLSIPIVFSGLELAFRTREETPVIRQRFGTEHGPVDVIVAARS